MRAAFGKVNALHNHVLPGPTAAGEPESAERRGRNRRRPGHLAQRILPPQSIFLEGTGKFFRGTRTGLQAAAPATSPP